MLRSLYITAIYFAFLLLGVAAPFVFSLGYVWVDTFVPQNVSYMILPSLPVSFIMGAAAVGGYILLDRRSPPPIGLFTLLTVALAIWVTLSTAFWAVVPDSAWLKWDWAFKTVLFSAFFPFVFRSRIQIEAFLQVYLFALTVHFLPVALKTVISGGGYGQMLSVAGTQGDFGLSEGSTLSAVSLMMVPIMLYLRAHTRILPNSVLTDAIFAGLIGAAVMLFTSDTWNARVSTIQDYNQEGSALGRILVWQWTLDFVANRPQGGGFNAYQLSRIVFPGTETNPEPIVVIGKAFHSIYFEMLGEQGWFGFGLFLGLIAVSFLTQQNVVRRTKRIPEMLWCRELAIALQVSLVTMLACGAFIGVAFQPMLYYLFAISACLGNHVRQALRSGVPSRHPMPAPRTGIRWTEAEPARPLAMAAQSAPARKGAGKGWRERL
jgi:putative inorganic carbon (hco3(-)) transporter